MIGISLLDTRYQRFESGFRQTNDAVRNQPSDGTGDFDVKLRYTTFICMHDRSEKNQFQLYGLLQRDRTVLCWHSDFHRYENFACRGLNSAVEPEDRRRAVADAFIGPGWAHIARRNCYPFALFSNHIILF